MTTSGITNINAKLIHQHPDNPRKDLGDLSELSESIKKKGIMQNLTVIPGYWDENRAHHDEGYTLIIGHRRFAAGKMAGVTMYPCRIVQDMSYKDQVGTMLEENMQRIDLTVLEQAEGFQMMLNLGDTEEQIAEKTGFSRTTVHRRLEIAKLDRDLVKEKTDENGAYQLNLKDLPELSSNLTKANNILTNMESNLMAINTYHMTLNTSNVKTPDSWIECNRIGNLVMINGCAKITKAVNTYSVLNIASGAPVPCCNKQLYTVAIAQDNTYSNCFLEVSKSGAVNLLVRWQKASSGDIFYYEFCYICK